jgi:hypothetical protein
MNDRIATSLHTGLLIAVLGMLTWASGLPTLFPSLGPSAFVLAMFPESEASNPKRVVGSHVLGVVAGFLAYHLFAPGVVVTGPIPPFSHVGLRLAVSSVVAIVLTVTGMLHFGIRHPPACATTLIVALGLLPTVSDGVVIIIAVVVIVAVQLLLLRIDEFLGDVTNTSLS